MSVVGVSVSSGRVFEIAGDPDGYQLVPCDGSGQAARFSNPRGLVVTADGIYVSDYWAIRWVQ